jgi:hypothetical protein
VAISKDALTLLLGAGVDVSIDGLPDDATRRLEILYPELVAG